MPRPMSTTTTGSRPANCRADVAVRLGSGPDAAYASPMTPAAPLRLLGALAVLAGAGLLLATPADAASGTAREQVWAAETAFARSMADRNLQAFGDLIADEAVFFDGSTALRGKAAVLAGWAAFFSAADAPFSWHPDQVEVLASGTLALSTGPVLDRSGKVIARFNSVWRLEAPGRWRVVFDKGSPPSPGPK